MTKKVSGTCDLVSTTYANLVADVKKDETLLAEKKLIRQNDVVVIVIGLAFTTGSTNLVKIHRVGAED
jgi:hypothetical protein